jgi:hypothetical protein
LPLRVKIPFLFNAGQLSLEPGDFLISPMARTRERLLALSIGFALPAAQKIGADAQISCDLGATDTGLAGLFNSTFFKLWTV